MANIIITDEANIKLNEMAKDLSNIEGCSIFGLKKQISSAAILQYEVTK